MWGASRGGGAASGAEFTEETAAGKKLFLSPLVREQRAERRVNSLWLGREGSLTMLRTLRGHRSCQTASAAGKWRTGDAWAVSTTLCSAFRFETERLPYHTEMQSVRMLLMARR